MTMQPDAGRPVPEPTPSTTEETTTSTSRPAEQATGPAAKAPAGKTRGSDPLRGSRTSGIWVAVVGLVVLLVLLAIFVLQNTRSVEVTFLGWSGSAPLAAALLIATAAGLLIAVAAGGLRILQLRRRVRQARRA